MWKLGAVIPWWRWVVTDNRRHAGERAIASGERQTLSEAHDRCALAVADARRMETAESQRPPW
jgi:hypothetical protein